MKWPIDVETLVRSDRDGVEIDYCPQCREVWLDRGESDKIIERAGGGPNAPQRSASVRTRDGVYRRRQRESLPGELFDF